MKEQTGRMTHRLYVKITAFLLVFAMACTAMASLPAEVFAENQTNNSGALLSEDGFFCFNNHTYRVFDDSMDWYSAKDFCESLGGHLATITSGSENSFILSLLQNGSKRYYWLGASDSIKEGDWKWITDEAFCYTNWGQNQPDNKSYIDFCEENYLVIFHSHGLWNDLQPRGESSGNNVLSNLGFICEWESPLEKMELDRSSMKIVVNKSITLNAAINSEIIKNEVLTWVSTDESIATVSKSGKVTGVSSGKATIYVSANDNYLGSCEVTVESWEQKYTIDGSDFLLGTKTTGQLMGPSVDFLDRRFDLITMDVGWNVILGYVSCEYDQYEKKMTVKIGKLKDYDDKIEDDNLWRNEYNEIKQFTKAVSGKTPSTNAVWNEFSKMRSKLKKHSMKLGFEYDGAIYGYVEFDCSSGEPKFCEGGMVLSSTTSASIKYHPVPILFAKLSLTGEVSGKFAFNCLRVGDSKPKISCKIELGISVSPELSVGAEANIASFEIASVESGIRGTLSGTVNNESADISQNITIKFQGSIFLKANAIGFIKKEWNSYGKEYQLFPPESSTKKSPKKAAASRDNTATANDFTLVPRAKKTSRKAVAPKNYKTAVGQNLVSNVFPYSEPKMLQLSGDKVLAVWVDDDTSRSEINRTALMYTYFDGSQWSAIQQVNNDGTPDYSPKLIRHGDGAYLVWQNADQVFADGMTLLETASHYNISVAYFDGSSFGEVRNVNDYDNSTLEIQPLLISDGSNLTSVWVEATDNYVYGDQTVFALCKASANASDAGTGAEKRVVLAENISNLSAIDAAFFNGDEYILYSTSESDDIHFFKNGTETTLTGMSSNFRIVDGKLYWFTNDGVKFAPLDDLDSVTDTAIAFSGNAGNIQFLHNASGGRAIIWKQTEDLKSELFVSYYDTVNKAWGQGIQITNCNAAIADYTAMLDNENKISYIIETREVLEGDEYPYGTANLLMNSYTKVTDIKTDGIYYNSTEIVPNGTVEFSTGIVNVGTETVSSVTVELLDDSDNVLGTAVYEEPILSGESADVAISTTLPEDLASFGVKMRVTTQGDVDTSNNTTEITHFALPNIVLDTPTVTDTTADGAQIKVNISNEGFADANAVTVNLYQDNTDTEPIATQTIDGLAKGDSTEISFSVSRDLLTENEYPYLNQFVVSASVEEDELLYIDNTQVCQVESMRVTGVSFESPSGLSSTDTLKATVCKPSRICWKAKGISRLHERPHGRLPPFARY